MYHYYQQSKYEMNLKKTTIEDHNSVRINYRIETVSDREDGAVTELFSDGNLNQTVGSDARRKRNFLN
jgi:hypothetical protein